MKRLIKITAALLVLCLVMTLGAVTVMAEGLSVGASSATAERGGTASVSVSVSGNPGLWGLKLRIYYDHAALTLTSASAGGVFTSDELTLSENLNKDPFVVLASGNQLSNKTSDGSVVNLTFTVNGDAANGSYPITVEVAQANNAEGVDLPVSGYSGSITVADCIHSDKVWKTEKAATCKVEGSEVLTCSKCGETFDTRSTTGDHKNTYLTNERKPTVYAEGYTGDTYCRDCGKLVTKGEPIEKLEEPPTEEVIIPQILSGKHLVFKENSKASLMFVASGRRADLLRVEVNSQEVPKESLIITSGGDDRSTIVMVRPDYLNELPGGEHSLNIVFTGGEAGAAFTVEKEPTVPATEATQPTQPTQPPVQEPEAPKNNTPVMILLIALIVIAVADGVLLIILLLKRRERK